MYPVYMKEPHSTAAGTRLKPLRRIRRANVPGSALPARGMLPALEPASPAIRRRLPTVESRFEIPAVTPVGFSLAARLEISLADYCTQHRKCGRKCSEKAVHQLRISIRKLLAQLALLECLTPGPELDRARRTLKKRLKQLSELRDTHVQLVFVRAQLDRFPEMQIVEKYLRKRERKLVKDAARKVRRLRLKKLYKWVRRIAGQLTGKEETAELRAQRLYVLSHAVGQSFEAVLEQRTAVDPGRPATIHRTRIGFKKFRYMLETLAPLVPGLGARELRALAWYQRRMGNIQDLEVLQAMLTGFLKHTPGAESVLQRFRTFLSNARRRAIQRFLARADQVYEFWPTRSAENGCGRPPQNCERHLTDRGAIEIPR
jgi:CHAD domain-containing protein